jgi:hypothetical protein
MVKKIDIFPMVSITYYNLQGNGMHITPHKFNTTKLLIDNPKYV